MLAIFKRLLPLLLLTASFLYAEAPNWTINPTDFQFSCTVTGVLLVNDSVSHAGGNIVGAFVGNELRGVVTPIDFGNNKIYYLTIFSNSTSPEVIQFKSYIATEDTVTSIQETLNFSSNEVTGNPLAPFQWHTYARYDRYPVVAGIPDQTIEKGTSFGTFDLDQYLTEYDGDQISWSITGNNNLQVSINPQNIVTITPSSPSWTGSEELTFTATDNTTKHHSAFEKAVFSVITVDHAPVVQGIPNQTIGMGGKFLLTKLNNFLSNPDGDGIEWRASILPVTHGESTPSWTINPSDYQFSMTLTTVVKSDGNISGGTSHMLAAFAGNELRGLTHAVSFNGDYLYFLTIYSNTQGEQLCFRFYDSLRQETLPVLEKMNFAANTSSGTPQNPKQFNAGHFVISINSQDEATVMNIDSNWSGSEQILFIAKDHGTIHSYSDTAMVTFTVAADHNPIVEGIPNQQSEQGFSFAQFDLDDYLHEYDGQTVTWNVENSSAFTATIGAGNMVTVVANSSGFIGTQNIIFKVTDNTPYAFWDADTVAFTVLALDHPPQVGNIPNQKIGLLGKFTSFDLGNYLTELDGNPTKWTYTYQGSSAGQPAPSWTIQPADFSYSMNITAQVNSRGNTQTGNGSLLAAFAGNELRGFASPTMFNGEELYFLTLYSNTDSEPIQFKFYDGSLQELLRVYQQTLFSASASEGTPNAPYVFDAGNIIITLSGDNHISLKPIDSLWYGIEKYKFTATDMGSLHGYSSSKMVTFSVENDHVPVVKGIPDYIIENGQSFVYINLNNYLHEYDGNQISWSAHGNKHLTQRLYGRSDIYFYRLDTNWVGSDTIEFRATDITSNAFYGIDTAILSIRNIDHVPTLSAINPQITRRNGHFSSVNLTSVLNESDGDSIAFSIEFKKPLSVQTPPSWTINPADFQYSMTITAEITSLGSPATGSNHTLGAFVGNELRGVSNAVEVMGKWLYFLNVYSNNDSENVTFSFFDAGQERLLPILESFKFGASSVFGTPVNPQQFYAGNVEAFLQGKMLRLPRLASSWIGSETLKVTVQDRGTQHEYSSSREISLSALEFGFTSSKATIQYGDIPVSHTAIDSVTISNSSGPGIELVSVESTHPDITVVPVSSSIPPGGAQTFVVTFLPGSRGLKQGNIIFKNNVLTEADTLPVSGTGISAQFVSSKNTLDFGPVTVTETKVDSFALVNVGNIPLEISSINSMSSQFNVSIATATVDPQATKMVYVTFAPSGGLINSAIIFHHNADSNPDTISITGTGTFHGKISGTVYNDVFGNGTRDTGDSILTGWNIVLENNGVKDTISTGTDGTYTFSELSPATYSLIQLNPNGYAPVYSNGSISVTLSMHEVKPGLDFPTFKLGTIEGITYIDHDSSGGRESYKEELFGGFPIELRGNHTPAETTYSSAEGTFRFSNVGGDTFSIRLLNRHGYNQTEPSHSGIYPIIMRSGLDSLGFTFGNFDLFDTLQFRTFTTRDYVLKSAAVNKHGIIKKPTAGNIRDSVFVRRGFQLENADDLGYLRLGVRREDSSTFYGWLWHRYIRYNRNAVGHYIFNKQVARRKGANYFTFTGQKVDEPSFGNAGNNLSIQLAALKTNIGASDLGITTRGLGDLLYTASPASAESLLNGKSLRTIASMVDTALSMGKFFSHQTGIIYRYPLSHLILLDSVITKINREFSSSIIDTVSTSPLRVRGMKSLFRVPYLKRDTAATLLLAHFNQGNIETNLPRENRLMQNYPNPFNPSTTIGFTVSDWGIVTLKIYTVLGQEVAIILDHESFDAGSFEQPFNASNLASGVYFYRLTIESPDDEGNIATFKEVKRMVLMK